MAHNPHLPPALVVPGAASWYGNDGSWYAFTIAVGTPPQNFSVLPATNGQNTWVPIADDCKSLNVTNCGSKRGVLPFNNSPSPGFQTNVSSTWKPIGLYRLNQNSFLGFSGSGLSGYDTVGFVSDNVSNTLQVTHQPVTAYASPEFWLGQIGLGKRGLNFRQGERPESFLRSLKSAQIIPSESFGYTAGASYRLTRVAASLTLGGYDQARMGEPLKVSINKDDERPLTVALQSIVVTNSFNGTISLSNTALLVPIDSSVSDLWLPRSICDRFASAFGLQYIAQTNRYILSSETNERLKKLSPVLSFTIGTQLVEGTTIVVQLPYAAMDLQASTPIFANTINYFPIRRAANDSQYMIGRAFLQEVYIGADYERGYFNVSQAVFTDPMPVSKVVTIAPANSTASSSSTTSAPLSHAAAAGISIGTFVGIILIGVLVWYMWRRPAKDPKVEAEGRDQPVTIRHPEEPEILGNAIGELLAPHGRHEARGGWPDVVELAGSSGPLCELSA